MPEAALQFYDTDDSTLSSEHAFGTVANGAESSAKTWHVWNQLDDATADTAQDVRIRFEASDDGGSTWSATHTAITSGWVQAKVDGDTEGSSNTITSQTSSYRPVTNTSPLLLDNIPADCARHVFVKIAIPNGAVGSSQVDLRIIADWSEPRTISGVGHYKTGNNGVWCGLGQQDYTDIISGATLAESGTPDSDVQVTDDTLWVHQGVPKVKLSHAITLDNTDGDAVTLNAGEEYIATISLGSSTTFTVTKSSKGSSPLPTSSRPAVPAGERLVGYVVRDDSGTIQNADIDQSDREYGFFNLETSALTATVHRGDAMVSNSLARWTSSRTVTLTASETNTIYLQPDGTLENVTSGNSPTNGRSLALWEVTTDGSGETARQDLRLWATPRLHRIEWLFPDALTNGEERHKMLPTQRDVYVLLPNPVYMSLGETGSTSGQSIADIEYSDAGGAWTTLFTSQGTDDKRPTVAFDASDPTDDSALPEVATIPGGSRIKMVIDDVDAGGTAADLYLSLFVIEAGR